MSDHKGLPIVGFATRADWEGWLDEHGTSSPGLWVKLAKKDAGRPGIGRADAVEGALAHGWIDGQSDRVDDAYWLTRFTPRRAGSRWSQVNCAIVERLMAEGRMTVAGLGEVERAKEDGRWGAAYAPPSRAEAPDDLRAALDAEPAAAAFFATLKGANRYAVIYRVNDTRTAKTRAARIAKFVAMLAKGETIYGQKARSPRAS